MNERGEKQKGKFGEFRRTTSDIRKERDFEEKRLLGNLKNLVILAEKPKILVEEKQRRRRKEIVFEKNEYVRVVKVERTRTR